MKAWHYACSSESTTSAPGFFSRERATLEKDVVAFIKGTARQSQGGLNITTLAKSYSCLQNKENFSEKVV